VLIKECIGAIDRRIDLDSKSDADFLSPRITLESSVEPFHPAKLYGFISAGINSK